MRINVTRNAGSGKSTLSQQLSRELGLPLIEMDRRGSSGVTLSVRFQIRKVLLDSLFKELSPTQSVTLTEPRLNHATQEQFAAKLGMTVVTVNRWENYRSKPMPLALRQLRTSLIELSQSEVKADQEIDHRLLAQYFPKDL